jgi:cob(I)alamin adenosyltransferase
MANVYTRTGDDGTTSLADGSRVSKDDPRVELFGAIDEASCLVGLARVNIVDSDLDAVLEFVQQRLFNCSACLANPEVTGDVPFVRADDVKALEDAIDKYVGRMGPMVGFILPGCDEASARLHVARAVMRRAERAAVTLAAVSHVDPEVLAFLNRSSDMLYVAARYTGSGNECRWNPEAEPPQR